MPQQLGRHRRSKRLDLAIPVRVYGRTADNRPFRDAVETNAVSVHGGLLPLKAKVKQGQTLLLVNVITEEERECRVVYVQSNLWNRKIAVEFTNSTGDFWHVYGSVVSVKSTAGKSDP